MSELRWHLRRRSDGDVDEYAVDSDGRPCFLIEKVVSTTSLGDVVVGWQLYTPYSFTVEPFPCERIEWECLWECSSIEQARREAEIRHANSSVYTVWQWKE